MSPWILRLKEFVEPFLFDLAVSKVSKKMTDVSNNQTAVTIAEKSANFLYKGPMEMISDEVSAFAEKSIDDFCDSEDETDLLAISIGKFASLGCYYFLTNGEIDGAVVSTIIGKTTENLVHKGLLSCYCNYLEKEDKRRTEQAERDLEIYGYGGPGF
jgi:hypothetical protein